MIAPRTLRGSISKPSGSTSVKQTWRNTCSHSGMLFAPKPRRSRSRVFRCGSLLHSVKSSAVRTENSIQPLDACTYEALSLTLLIDFLFPDFMIGLFVYGLFPPPLLFFARSFCASHRTDSGYPL